MEDGNLATVTTRFTRLATNLAPPQLAGLLALLYFFGATAYSIIVPIFEGPDEREHFEFVRFLRENGRIPDLRTEYGGYDREATQGPLYYLVAAVASAPFDFTDSSALPLSNPQATSRDLHGYGNRNGFVHTPGEDWPYHAGIIRAIHVVRLVSAAFGAAAVAATVLLTYRFSARAALVAGLLVGGLPQFLFMGGIVNNDVASAATSAFSLLALIRYWEHPGWLPAVIAGFVIGLAVLAKAAGLWLLPLAAGVVWLRRQELPGKMLSEGAIFLVVCMGVCGWWLGMNMAHYGDPTGITEHLRLQPGEQVDITVPANLLTMVHEITTSFWAVFGLSNIAAPRWIYMALNVLALISLTGLLLSGEIKGKQPLLWICLVWCVLIICAALAWAIRVKAWHGRLFFPALVAGAVLMSVGIDNLHRRWRREAVLYMLPISLVLFSALAPLFLILPAYAVPPIVAALPKHVEPLCMVFQGRCSGCSCASNPFAPRLDARCALFHDPQLSDVELLGVDVPDEVQPGGTLAATFYWRAMGPITYDLMLFVNMLDDRFRSVASEHTYQGQGNWPTKLWQPKIIYADTVWMQVSDNVKVPALGQITLALDRYGQNVVATCRGVPIEIPFVGSTRIVHPTQRPMGTILTVGDTLTLTSATWQNSVRAHEHSPDWPIGALPTLPIRLMWYVENSPIRQLKRFVHLEHLGNLHAQSDDIPASFPASAWRPGDVLPDPVHLSLPPNLEPGTYTLYVGIYDDEGVRLPTNSSDNRMMLGTVEITR